MSEIPYPGYHPTAAGNPPTQYVYVPEIEEAARQEKEIHARNAALALENTVMCYGDLAERLDRLEAKLDALLRGEVQP